MYVTYVCRGVPESGRTCGLAGAMEAHKWRQRCGQASYRQSACLKCKNWLASRDNRMKGMARGQCKPPKDIKITAPYEADDPRGAVRR